MSPSASMRRPTWIPATIRIAAGAVMAAVVAVLASAVSAGAPPTEQTVVPLAHGFERSGHITGRCELGCKPFWTRVMADAHTGLFSFYGEDVPFASDKSAQPIHPLLIPADASAATLTFWHRYSFEMADGVRFFDGGVLEVSTDDGESWQDAGAQIVEGGYTGTIVDFSSNVLGGRQGWVGQNADWHRVTVDLLTYRSYGFRFRLRLGTDSSNVSKTIGWYVDDVEVRYDAPLASCARTWSTIRPYPVGIYAAAAASVNQVLYVFGGVTMTGTTADAYAYSPEDDAWTAIAPLPERRSHAAAVSDGTYVYIVGGAIDDQVAATLWRYDPTANAYATLAPHPFGVANHAVAFEPLDGGGLIYRVGGTRDFANPNYVQAVNVYSLSSNLWGDVFVGYPEPVALLALGVHRGILYSAGGTAAGGPSAKTYDFDRSTGSLWEDDQIADLPSKSIASGAFYKGHFVVNADGAGLSWDFPSNQWRSLDQIPRDLYATAAVAGDAFYLIGGIEGMAPSDVVQRYVETDCAAPTPTITPPREPTATPPREPTATQPPGGACIGDCDGNRQVAIAELIRGVGIALGAQPVSACSPFDGNSDGLVGINELVAAVSNALVGCA